MLHLLKITRPIGAKQLWDKKKRKRKRIKEEREREKNKQRERVKKQRQDIKEPKKISKKMYIMLNF